MPQLIREILDHIFIEYQKNVLIYSELVLQRIQLISILKFHL